MVTFYTPLFWTIKEKKDFLARVYDLFWVNVDLDIDYPKAMRELDFRFPENWYWWEYIPSEGPLRDVLDYPDKLKKKAYETAVREASKSGETTVKNFYPKEWNCLESVLFWRHCWYHRNDYINESHGPVSNPCTFVCTHTFQGLKDFYRFISLWFLEIIGYKLYITSYVCVKRISK